MYGAVGKSQQVCKSDVMKNQMCEKSGTMPLVLVDLMAGRLPGRQNTGRFIRKFLKYSTDYTGVRIFMKELVLSRSNQCISVGFLGKVYCKVCCGGTKSRTPCFLC